VNELPKGWANANLGNIANVQSGVGFPKKHQGVHDAEYPVYKVGDVSRAYLKNKANLYIAENTVSEETANLLKGKIFNEGSVLFAKIGEALKLNRRVIVTKSGLADNNVMGVTAELKESEKYIYRFLQYYDVASLSRSTTVPSIRKSDVEEIQIPFPPLNEQTRIADKLDSMLAKVYTAQARLDKIPNILKRFRQSVLAAATSGELTKEWREENQVIFNWDEINVSEIVSKIEAGKSIKCEERPPREDEFGIIKISAVTWGKYNEEESKTLKDKSIFLENRRVQVGDFLISRANTLELLGMPVIVHEVTKNLMLSDKVLRLVMDEIEKKWLNYYFRSPMGRTQIENGSSGNQESMRNIGQKALMAITLNNPPLDEKQVIIRRVESLFTMADTVDKQYKDAKARTNRLTQSILAKAFCGELVPQDANDEPAELLLQKIQVTQQKTPKPNKRKNPVPIKTAVSNTLNIENVKKWIDKTESETFSSEDIIKSFSSSYEELKQVIFLLLNEKKPSVEQVFDSKAKDFLFRKVK
jgi:type I restriction enzyme S subunit